MATNNDIGARIKEARKAAGYSSATAAAEALGIAYPTYAGHENGSRDATASIAVYARRYNVSTDWLLTGRGRGPKGSGASVDVPTDTLGPAIAVSGRPEFAGTMRAGRFMPLDDYFNQDPEEVPEFVTYHPAYPKVRQYVWKSSGDSMNEAGILDGMWVVGADAADFIDTYGEIESGELVVVERTRNQGSEREVTVKEVRFYRDRYELIPRSSNPEHQVIVVPHDHEPDDGIEVKIIALVLASYTDLRRRNRR